MTLLFWNAEHWTIAGGWFEQRHGWLPLPGGKGAVIVQEAWFLERSEYPSPCFIVNDRGQRIVEPRNQGWANRTMFLAGCEASLSTPAYSHNRITRF